MNLLQVPPPLVLAGNINEFRIASDTDISFRFGLYVNGSAQQLLSENHTPANGVVRIDVKAIIERNLSVDLPSGQEVFEQVNAYKQFYYQINNSTPVTFRAVKGGVDGRPASFDSDAFLKENFLSWQPQKKGVTSTQSEYLSYLFRGDETVITRAYYKNDDGEILHSDVTLFNHRGTVVEGVSDRPGVYTLDVSMGVVAGLFSNVTPLAWDVWVNDALGNRLTYIQRFLLESAGDDDEIYVFINTLAGIDTLRCTGRRLYLPKTEAEVAIQNGISLEVNSGLHDVHKQYTGFVSTKEQAYWLLDFFMSTVRYHLTGGGLRRIIIEQQEQEWQPHSAAGFSFSFRYADRTRYNFVDRTAVLPEVADLIDPSALFFLERRLADYPVASDDGDWFIPVQDQFGHTWYKLPARSIAVQLDVNQNGYTDGLMYKNVNGERRLALKVEAQSPETLNQGHFPLNTNSQGELYVAIPWQTINN